MYPEEIIYYRFGRKFRKIGRDEIIKYGAMHSYDHFELNPILHDSTVGKTPADFSSQRNFYNPIED